MFDFLDDLWYDFAGDDWEIHIEEEYDEVAHADAMRDIELEFGEVV